jgi:GAF domain-containing protein
VSNEQTWSEDRDRFVADHARLEKVTGREAALQETPAELGPLADQFGDLARALLDVETVAEVLERVVRATLEIVPGAELVSVTLCEGGGFTTPFFTDQKADEIDQVQYDADEGPCLEAIRADGSGFAWSADLASDDDHWPKFGPRAAELGMGSVLGVGLFPGGETPRNGALNIYSTRAHGLDAADRNIALLLASHASVALARARDVSAARLEATQLSTALQSRDVIGQAKGILMERRGLDAGAAFDVLRSASQDLNVKLTEIAATLVDRRADL